MCKMSGTTGSRTERNSKRLIPSIFGMSLFTQKDTDKLSLPVLNIHFIATSCLICSICSEVISSLFKSASIKPTMLGLWR